MPTAPSSPRVLDEEDDGPTPLPAPVETMEAEQPDAAGPNLALRKQQLRQMVDQRQPTQTQPPTLSALATPQGNGAAFRAEQQGREDAIHEQAMAERETTITQRRQQIAEKKATNAQREASFRSTGQKFYTDPYGALQPVVEAGTNRPLYQPTLWEDGGKHPKTGEPTLVKRDQYGQRQYKSPMMVAGADPHDTQLYYKFAEDDLRPAGDLTALKAHANPAVARLARQTDARRRQAMWKEALLPMEEAKKGVDLEYDAATQRKLELQNQIDQVTGQLGAIPEATLGAKSGGILGFGGTPTPEAAAAQTQKAGLDQRMQALVLEQADLDEKLKPMGALGRMKRNAQLDLAIFKAKATHENYGDLAEERRDILKQQGKSEADDPILKSILTAQKTYGDAVQRAAKVVEREAGVAQQRAPIAPPAEPAGTLPEQWAKAGPLERLKMMGGSKGFGPNEVEGATPMIGSEAAGTKGGLFTIPKAEGTGTGAGIINAANKFSAGLTTPENAAILAATGGTGALAEAAAGTKVALTARAAETAAMGGFTGMMAKDTVTAVGEARKVLADPKATDAEKADVVTSVGLAALMTGASAAGTKTLAGKTAKEFRATPRTEPPAPAAEAAPTGPKPTPDPATLDRLAKIAEMPPEQAEAEFAKLEAEFSNETKTPAARTPEAQPEAAAVPVAGDRATATTEPVAAVPETAAPLVAPALDVDFGDGTPTTTPEVVAGEAKGPRSNFETTGMVFPTEKSAIENAEPHQSVRRTRGGSFEVMNGPARERERWTPDIIELPSMVDTRVFNVGDEIALDNAAFGEGGRIVAKGGDHLIVQTPHGKRVRVQARTTIPFRSAEENAALDAERAATPVPIGSRDETVSTGTGVPTARETEVLAEQRRLVEEHLAGQAKAATETLVTPDAAPAGAYDEGIRGMPAPLVRNREALAKKYGFKWNYGALGEDNEALLTPDEVWAANGKPNSSFGRPASKRIVLENHRDAIEGAVKDHGRVNVAAVEQYDVKLPPGYARDGAHYVFTAPTNPTNVRTLESIKAERAKRGKEVPAAPPVARETIDTTQDKPMGKNAAAETLQERPDGTRYRMRNDRRDRPQGYPDFGGDLAPVELALPASAPKPAAVPDYVRRRQEGEAESRFQGTYQRLMRATKDDKSAVASEYAPAEAKRALDQLNAAPGFDADAKAALESRASTPPETKSIAAKLPEVSTPEVVTGEPISKKWTAFGPESQSLGVPRAEMPQVKSEARGALVNFLKARGIDAKSGMVMPSKLKPTQAEFSPEKVQQAREHTGSERPILISSDGHVVDGHHQWMAALDDTQTPMPVIRLNAPIEKVLSEMKDFPSTESAAGAKPSAEVAPAPKATIPLSDRAIAALQKAKIRKPGQLSIAAEPFSIAYDAAIDLAILGIRAGRKVADVIKLAIDRFKAKHPQHTPEELARVEAAVRSAVETPMPTPTEGAKKKSLLPESLKDAGAPVDSIEYAVRQQDARKQEASDIIKKDGAARAEEMMVKSDLPGDTRVAIGGQLINERMLAMKEAKPEDVSKISRDIQRITAKMQPELATAAGQQISMFAGIYRDVRVAAATEYIRGETKRRVDAMGGPEVEKAAQEAADAFNRTKDAKEREAAIERLKEKYTTKPVRRALDQLKRVEVTKHLNDLGALTRDDMIDAAGNALGLPGISAKKLQHLSELADKITNAKNHAERSRAELDLASALNVYKGIEAMDVASSLMTANILSGYTTQAANIEGNALNLIGQLASTAAVNPTKLGPLVKGFLDGLPLARDQAKSIWQTGRGTRDFQDKTAGAGSVLSTVDFARDFPSVPKPIGDVATTGARVIDRIFRFMKAADAVFYYPAREAYARMVATKLLEGQYRGAELDTKVSQLLHTTPAAFESARRQAVLEGYEGVDLGRRVADIIEDRRTATPTGTAAVKESERFAAETTFTNEPEGLAGVAYHALKYAVQEGRLGKVPILKPWAMFLKTPANVFNTTLNYTPVGALRANRGMRGAGFRNPEWRNFTKDERQRLYLQSVVGTAIMGAMVSRILNNDGADVSAQGPEDAAKRQQLRNAGWSPYSIKSGDKWISYKDSPLLVPLAIVGHVADSIKYNSPQKDVPLEQRVAEAVASSPQTIFQTSMLTGLADLMGAMSGKGGAGVGRTLGSIPANLVIPYNRLLQQIDQTFDPQTYDNPPVVGAVPFARRMGTPQTDVQGRPQQYSPSQRFGSSESRDAVDALIRDKQVFIPDVGRDVKLGDTTMTDAQHEAFRRISGQRIRIRLQAIAPRLRILTQEKAQDEITQIAREEREKVKPLIRAGVGVRKP